MHPTGIEPVTTPWKGAILPLYYECVEIGTPYGAPSTSSVES